MATRPEVQVAGDWALVPSARQLDWRRTVLHSAFMTRKQRISLGESLNKNLRELFSAMEKIWKRVQAKTAAVKSSDGKVENAPFNGDVR